MASNRFNLLQHGHHGTGAGIETADTAIAH